MKLGQIKPDTYVLLSPPNDVVPSPSLCQSGRVIFTSKVEAWGYLLLALHIGVVEKLVTMVVEDDDMVE